MSPSQAKGRSATPGFSMIELLVVAGIILIAAAVSVPAIARYIRNYEIRAAAQTIADQINNARLTAIKKNVNWGIVFMTGSNQTYAIVMEDDQTPAPYVSTRQAMAVLVADPSQRLDPATAPALSQLPTGIFFAAAGQCPTVAAWNPDDSGFRFNRLGAWCDPGGAGNCPAIGMGQNFVWNIDPANPGSTICLRQPTTGLTRWVRIAPGGRIQMTR